MNSSLIKDMVREMCLENALRKQAIEEIRKENENPDQLFVLRRLMLGTAMALKAMTECEPNTINGLVETTRYICGVIEAVDKHLPKVISKSKKDILKCAEFDKKVKECEFIEVDELRKSLLLKIVQPARGMELDIIRHCLNGYSDALMAMMKKINPNEKICTIDQLRMNLEQLNLPKKILQKYRSEFIDAISDTYYMAFTMIEELTRDYMSGVLESVIEYIVKRDTEDDEDE